MKYPHKVLGYALSGVTHDPETFNVTDPRIDSAVLAAIHNKEKEISDIAFSEFLINEVGELEAHDAILRHSADEIMRYLSAKLIREDNDSNGFKCAQGVIYNAEHISPDTFMLVPYSNISDWIRRPSPIDHAEQAILYGDSTKTIINNVPRFVYPFDLYMNASTGVTLTNSEHNQVDLYRQMKANYDKAIEGSPLRSTDIAEIAFEKVAVKAGFLNYEDFLTNCVFVIPDEIKDYVRMTGLFPDEKTVLQLRPMVMTFWW